MSGLVTAFGRVSGVGAWAVILAAVVAVSAQERGAKPLGEEDLVKLLELQVGDDAVVGRIEKGGLGFAVDEAALDRLRTAGASEAVLEVVREAAAKSKPQADAITYEDVRKLLELGIDEGSILTRLEKSPTRFVLDAKQREELEKLGATPRLVSAMEGSRNERRNPEINDFVLILDCSGSMQDATPDGSPKMEAARRAVTDLIERIPEGRRVAFIVYGHDKAAACRAV
ncbi:MAG TPA: vWA domain-containing protein, partial [Planctomycetaceae bacterium]